jgi:predicted DCC family thiol-disulfide oxidoreductase YuxK
VARPVLLYDGDCAFCSSCARVLERLRPAARVVPWQLADLGALGVSEQQASDAVQFIEHDGTIRSGHEAIAAILRVCGPVPRAAGRLLLLPGVSRTAATAYRLVAEHRHRLPGGTPACAPRSAKSSCGA